MNVCWMSAELVVCSYMSVAMCDCFWACALCIVRVVCARVPPQAQATCCLNQRGVGLLHPKMKDLSERFPVQLPFWSDVMPCRGPPKFPWNSLSHNHNESSHVPSARGSARVDLLILLDHELQTMIKSRARLPRGQAGFV